MNKKIKMKKKFLKANLRKKSVEMKNVHVVLEKNLNTVTEMFRI